MNPFAADLQFDLQAQLDQLVRSAAADRFDVTVDDGLVRVAPPSQTGDFQTTVALRLGRELGKPPAEVAEGLAEQLEASDLLAPGGATVSGKGFINLVVATEKVQEALRVVGGDARLGVGTEIAHQSVVIDYSAPNVAKEMHVGHLRSTILGDSLRRILTFLGHDVRAANHLGDWGTPFGMLIEHMLESGAEDSEVSRLTEFYRDARARFDSDEAFVEKARARVVLLQAGDPDTLAQWRRLRSVSESYFQDIYDAMDVLLVPEENVGESFYNPMLADVVDELEAKGLLEESDGALCLFLPGYVTRDGAPQPMIVRKSDGGYNYDTTDLAALRYRLTELKATAVLYVVGAPQKLHFDMVFDAGRAAGWSDGSQLLRHVGFGSVLGEDGKMLKTREGKTIKLRGMLDEAVERAREIISERDLSSDAQEELAVAVGVGSVKYADLSSDRVRDYTFDIDRMVTFEGNTAAYIQYARARAASLVERVGDGAHVGAPVILAEPIEREFGLHLLRFGVVLNEAAEHCEPHRLCTYLFELASLFSKFYEQCPVKGSEPDVLASRLALTDMFSRTLETGLGLLGIQAPKRI